MIDERTKQLIFDAASIVDVVGDFVSLRKQGASYIGLCPFHNDRRPSFHVSPAKNICKCFACGEGGTPISFLMKLEQMSYPEALRYLARKYNITIEEREETEDEKAQRMEAESLYIVQQFAADYFTRMLQESSEGQDCAMLYLRQRGIVPSLITKFAIGYSTSQRDGLYQAAMAAGLNPRYLYETGLCFEPNEGRTPGDRFRERVIFPIRTVSGRVVGFGGRIIEKKDNLAKYINSPESAIYSKSRELYGLFEGKRAISQHDKCFLVEGYMDVIALHRAGIENVVSSSGTALTQGQIRLIRRFTSNITVFYDGDAAGIKAALRGIDLLLEASMHVRVVLLPEGEDPDSFAANHTCSEIEAYITEHEKDFISFKTELYSQEAKKSPYERSSLINELLQSVALINDPIERSVFAQTVAQHFSLDEQLVLKQVKVTRGRYYGKAQEVPRAQLGNPESSAQAQEQLKRDTPKTSSLNPSELALLRLVVRHGEEYVYVGCDFGSSGAESLPLAQYVYEAILVDEITGCSALFTDLLTKAVQLLEEEDTRPLGERLAGDTDPTIAQLALDLLADKYTLSKSSRMALGIGSEATTADPEQLYGEGTQLINEIKLQYIDRMIDDWQAKLLTCQEQHDEEGIMQAMHEISLLNEVKLSFHPQ